MKKKWLAVILAGTMVLGLTATGLTAYAEDVTEAAELEETEKPSDVIPLDASEASALLEGFDTNADGFVIGFSNSYNGNSFRQKEEALFYQMADYLKEIGVISDYIVTESNTDNAAQASQIQSLVLKGCDAIIVDPGSPTALNAAIEEAWDAGVPCIIQNGGPVTTDKCYQIKFDYEECIRPACEFLADKLGGEGKVLISRGIAGVEADTGFYQGMHNVFDQYPGIEIVAEVYGQWTGSIAQKEIASVLPSLDQVDAVIGEGGDGYGAVQAFLAANREVPLVIGGNRGNFMSWWAEEYEKNGYESISWTTSPAIAAASILVACDILRGKEVPRDVLIGGDVVTQEDMIANIETYKAMGPDDIVGTLYDYTWIKSELYGE